MAKQQSLEWEKAKPEDLMFVPRKVRHRSGKCSRPGCNNQSNGYSQYCRGHHTEYMREYRRKQRQELLELRARFAKAKQ